MPQPILKPGRNALVLLSGGMDSTALLLLARDAYESVRALSFRYGQPNADPELAFAEGLAKRHGITQATLCLADALRGCGGLMANVLEPDASAPRSPSFVHGRNLVFATLGVAHGASSFADGCDVLLGCCLDDARQFPDCHAQVFDHLSAAASLGTGKKVRVLVPFAGWWKRGILATIEPWQRDEVRRSWSCYAAGPVPCGACGACIVRAEVMAKSGLVDEAHAPVMHGGDPQRGRRR